MIVVSIQVGNMTNTLMKNNKGELVKAIEILQDCIWDGDECDEAIEEIENMEAKLKQGQENYDKLWDMYSELKKAQETK